MAPLLFIVIWLAAVVATFVPVVPATLIIWGAALLHAILTGFQPLGWGFLAGLGALAIVAMLIDRANCKMVDRFCQPFSSVEPLFAWAKRE